MNRLVYALLLAVLLCPTLKANEALDSMCAYFGGEHIDYVLSAPSGCRLDDSASIADGYACAFLPTTADYPSSPFLIGIHFFRIRGMSFADAMAQDTSNLREHFGPSLRFVADSPLRNKSGKSLTILSLYLNDRPAELRTVAYFNGGTEIVMFELLTPNHQSAPEAVRLLAETIARFSSTTRKELGSTESRRVR